MFVYFTVELIQTHPEIFSDAPPRRLSDSSMQSTVSGLIDNIPLTTITTREFYTVFLSLRSVCIVHTF